MHRQLLNECRISGTISTTAPLLIRSAVETIGGPEVGVVLTVRDGLDQPYLPGSSLKGALRSQAERILHDFWSLLHTSCSSHPACPAPPA